MRDLFALLIALSMLDAMWAIDKHLIEFVHAYEIAFADETR
jgi:hypothetical protein